MTSPTLQSGSASVSGQRVRRIGCVSFLNALPLIDGLAVRPDPRVHFDVPSRLLTDLQAGQVDVALCPVIDCQRSDVPLDIIPAGAIGCRSTTLTVRLFSQSPLKELTQVWADTDSHTSIALLRVLLAELHHVHPQIISYDARHHVAGDQAVEWPGAMLLIGDKVVTDSPPAVRYPHQLDLGHAWHELTGLPFVFAVWMARHGSDLGDLPTLLARTRQANAQRLAQIVDRHAESHGWPRDLATQYLGHWLCYDVGPDQIRAINQFCAMAHGLGLIEQLRPLCVRPLA